MLNKTCECCGAGFTAKLKTARFCSKKCKDRQRALVPAIEATCLHCGVEFKAKRRNRSSYCSTTCQATDQARLILEVKKLRAFAKRAIKTITAYEVLVEKAALVRIKQKNKLNKNKVGDVVLLNCKCCGRLYTSIISIGASKKYCLTCLPEIYKKFKRKSKGKRRAIERNVEADNIDWVDVCQRDSWVCQECGISTPRSKRGTYNPDAPEIDHIIPLSKGGKHKLNNVRCLCRLCNGKKSDIIRGAVRN